MQRLIEKGLMFGNLVPVDSPVLVARYNRALLALTGLQTTLTDFHVDISGFSPEIGAELGDPRYLNPRGINRQFILLTLAQETAPLLDATFSTSRDILRRFMKVNHAQLFALTAGDAVAGELVNSVFDVTTPARLFDVRTIRIEADTTASTVATAKELSGLIDRFVTVPDGWFDDVLIAQMIDLAKETGDITRNPVILEQMTFEQTNFWTAHFGGLYVFRDVPHPATIAAKGSQQLDDIPSRYVFDLRDRKAIAKFLDLNDLAEPIAQARGAALGAILQQKMDFILVNVAADLGADLTDIDARGLRTLARQYRGKLPVEWDTLDRMRRWAVSGDAWPRIDADDPGYFYGLRARPGPDADLVNMLLAELTPLDVRQLFICHKTAFYDAYAAWPEAKQEYVANFLFADYMQDKAGTRTALFGDTDQTAAAARQRTMPVRRGPWG